MIVETEENRSKRLVDHLKFILYHCTECLRCTLHPHVYEFVELILYYPVLGKSMVQVAKMWSI